MELKGQDGNLGNNNPTFRESSETLDRRHQVQQNSSMVVQGRRLNADQFVGVGGGERIEQKLGGSSSTARYRECLKNHAASVGGNILDGCGEFMPSGDDGTLEALKCAACNCHRNFHRKELDGASSAARNSMIHPLQLPPPLPSPPLKHIQVNHWASINVPPVKIAFGNRAGGGSGGTDSSSEDLNVFQSNAAAAAVPPPYVMSKKRFRTKFTQEQKERMLEFAEKVGWRIPREDDAEVQRFCGELGVKRQVLKVWMHNNKNLATKKPQEEQEQEQQQQQQQQQQHVEVAEEEEEINHN